MNEVVGNIIHERHPERSEGATPSMKWIPLSRGVRRQSVLAGGCFIEMKQNIK